MSSDKAVVRKSTTDDIGRIYEFETQYIRELEPVNMERWESAERRTLEGIKESLNRTLILELGGVRAGHGRWETEENGVYITSLFIRSCLRGRKLGSFLLNAMEEEIANTGCERITLSTLTHNPARHLYDRRGYRRIKTDSGWIHYEKALQLK